MIALDVVRMDGVHSTDGRGFFNLGIVYNGYTSFSPLPIFMCPPVVLRSFVV